MFWHSLFLIVSSAADRKGLPEKIAQRDFWGRGAAAKKKSFSREKRKNFACGDEVRVRSSAPKGNVFAFPFFCFDFAPRAPRLCMRHLSFLASQTPLFAAKLLICRTQTSLCTAKFSFAPAHASLCRRRIAGRKSLRKKRPPPPAKRKGAGATHFLQAKLLQGEFLARQSFWQNNFFANLS